MVLFTSGAAPGAVADLNAPGVISPTQAAPPGFNLQRPTFMEFEFPASGIPAGSYTVFAALAAPGKLSDNRMDQGDIVVLDSRTFTYRP